MAGGTVAVGIGPNVPASSGPITIRWTWYGSGLDEDTKDAIQWGCATLDNESKDIRLLYGEAVSPQPADRVQLWFRAKSDPLSPACTDGVSGGCLYGQTTILSGVVHGAYKVCNQYRIDLYVENIRYGAQSKGLSFKEFMCHIVRHELGHVFGFGHDGEGPMANGALPFTPCQLAKLATYEYDPAAANWTVVDCCS